MLVSRHPYPLPSLGSTAIAHWRSPNKQLLAACTRPMLRTRAEAWALDPWETLPRQGQWLLKKRALKRKAQGAVGRLTGTVKTSPASYVLRTITNS